MTTIDKTVMFLLVLLGCCGFAYGYSDVFMQPIHAMATALSSVKP